MKRSRVVKPTRKRNAKRDLFPELSEGIKGLANARHGKQMLRTHLIELKPASIATPEELICKNLKSRD